MKPVAYRLVSPLEIKSKKNPQAGIAQSTTKKEESPVFSDPAPKLIIEEPKKKPAVTTSLGALSKIRQEVVNRKSGETGELKVLELVKLQDIWNRFSSELRTNKNPAFQSFEGAELRILDDQRFEILTNNNLEQRFIESEKRKLADLIVDHFKNKNISFSISIRENATTHVHLEKKLSKREQFQQIVELYPLVKELKDKLKLELDY